MFINEDLGLRNEKLLLVIGYTERKNASLTQAGLAELSSISTTYLRCIEKGTKSVSAEILYRICLALGIGILDFFIQVEKLMNQKNLLFL
ncbi:XRE family transcriptional regulator (modular protein) [Bacillus sp. 349Y]|nr:XRE family transcriptional regulator (modular protein) [Bacillus sp. 349Y]